MAATARATAFKNLLVAYDIIHGLMLLAVVALVFMADSLDSYSKIGGLFMLALQVGAVAAANVGIIRRERWGAIVAMCHTVVWILLMIAGQVATSARESRPSRDAAYKTGEGLGSSCPFIFHGLIVLFAWRAIKAPDDDADSTQQGGNDDALNILGLATAADGQQSPEKKALALQFAAQIVGPVGQNAAFHGRITHIAASLYPDQVLAKSAQKLQRVFTPEQKQWLIEAARAICSANGPPEPLAEDFLANLARQLYTAPNQVHEPFGRA